MKEGCDPNHVDTYGQTPIFYSIREGDIETTQLVVSAGADFNIVDHNGQTPIFYAIKFSRFEMVEFLI